MYCKKIHLTCEHLIKEFAILDIEKKIDTSIPVDRQIQIRHELNNQLKHIIDADLARYNIPPVRYCLSYIRPKNSFQGIHIDGNEEGIIKSAINIPLKGCKNSYQIWYKGKYSTSLVMLSNNVYHEIMWQEPHTEDFKLEIDSPHLLRVDCPHSAQSNQLEDRWVFTMRFHGNPNFEDLVSNV